MFWKKKETAVNVDLEKLIEEVGELQERVYDLEQDNEQLAEEVEDLASREDMFKQRLIETISDVPFSNPKLELNEDGVLEPVVPLGISIGKITYSPPCPRCGNDDHFNTIDGQPCVPIKIISPEGANCACSPIGEPHSDNCKGLTW